MVRRAGSSSKGLHLLDQEWHQRVRIEDRLGHLVEIGFVGRAAALHYAKEFVFHAFSGFYVNLSWQIAFRVDFFVHVQRSVLAVTKVLLSVGLEHSFRESLGIIEACPHLLSLLSVNDCRSRVLAERQLALCSHFCVAQKAQSDVFVVV